MSTAIASPAPGLRGTIGPMPLPTWILVLAGCGVVDAPEEIEDLAVFGFVEFEHGDSFRRSTADALVDAVALVEDELLEGYRVDSLVHQDLIDAGIEDAPEPRALIGIAAIIQMESALDDVIEVLTSPTLPEMFASTLEYDVHEATDRDCFLAHDCESYRFSATRTNDLGLVGTSVQDFEMTLYWVELSDGRTGVVVRQLSPDETEMSSGLLRLYQNYIFDFIEPTASGGTRRFEANWVDVEILGLDLPDSIALDLAVSSLQRRGAEIDAFLAGESP